MSDYYGKVVFKDGVEMFFVYATSPGWALRGLFASVDDAAAWKEQGRPSLERTDYQAIELSKSSEEPVHVLIDIDSPERQSMWFYSTASRLDMVITGPTSSEEAEASNEHSGGIYTKEFYDAWEVAPVANNSRARKAKRHDHDEPSP